MSELVGVSLYTLWLVIASVQDVKYRSISGKMMLIGAGIALQHSVYECLGGHSVWQMILGLLPGVAFLVLGYVTRCVGSADGMVLMLVGFYMGWKRCLWIWLLSIFLIGIWAMLYLVWKRGCSKRRLPYIPFLTLAWLVCLISEG